MSASHAKQASKVQKTAELQKPTLLIVDDQEGPRVSLRQIFKHDYHLLEADSGPAAIELVKEHSPDVVISDIKMEGGMSGIELLERIKFIDPAIEVIMITAYENRQFVLDSLKLHASDYLNKPFELSAIRKSVAEALRRRAMNLQVSEDARQLYQELERQKMGEQSAQTRGDIYASILHDIKGPLMVIGGFVDLMLERVSKVPKIEGADYDFIRQRLATIQRQVRNCAEISKRYIAIMRQDSLDPVQISVNQLLQDAGNMLRVHPSRGANSFKMEPLPPEDDLPLRMNGTDFIQILQNLVVNAFQATPDPHDVTVSMAVSRVPLDLPSLKDTSTDRYLGLEGFASQPPILQVTVRDTGPGIPLDVLPRIFQPYFTTKAALQGTGLGLSIVQRLIKQAEGLLHVSTNPGEGASFSFYVPAVAAHPSGG